MSAASSPRSTPKPLQVAAAVIGNALEWYDFIIFGFLTVVIARLFFPADSQYASLLSAIERPNALARTRTRARVGEKVETYQRNVHTPLASRLGRQLTEPCRGNHGDIDAV